MSEMIDLTSSISTKAVAPTKVKIRRVNHRQGARLLALEAIISEPGFWKKIRNIRLKSLLTG